MSPRPDHTAARRLILRRLLQRRQLGSQQQIVDALAQRGYPVTQTTVSRDLAALGAVRRIDDTGRARYVLGEDAHASAALVQLSRRLREFVVEISSSGNLVVIKTPPGAAHSVAVALDAASPELPGLLGTVAGDDTILAAARSASGGRPLARTLERLLGS